MRDKDKDSDRDSLFEGFNDDTEAEPDLIIEMNIDK